MNKNYLKNKKIPDGPGVYFWERKNEIIYIGKATSLKDRIKSYFSKDLIKTRGLALLDMVTISDDIKWQETDSVLEALILEANLIKKYKPKYNTKEKDNKSFNYVCFTKDKLPKVLVVRGRGLNKEEYSKIFGPFPDGSLLREAMKIIRRIFPYFDDDSLKKNNKEFYRQLGLIPELEQNNLSASFINDYKNNIKNLKLFFAGKKKNVLNNFKREMLQFAKNREFEKAEIIKKRIFSLNHINDVSLIKEESLFEKCHISESFRIEAYDIAHMSGKSMVGVMTVIENGEIKKSEYRKFIIRTQEKANDTGAINEILSRRLLHREWNLPNVIVVDGGIGQINIARKVIKKFEGNSISIASVVKDNNHKAKAIIGDKNIVDKYKREILLANNESHRFAINFHKQKRNKNFMI